MKCTSHNTHTSLARTESHVHHLPMGRLEKHVDQDPRRRGKWLQVNIPSVYHTNNVKIQEAVENMGKTKRKYHEKAFASPKNFVEKLKNFSNKLSFKNQGFRNCLSEGFYHWYYHLASIGHLCHFPLSDDQKKIKCRQILKSTMSNHNGSKLASSCPTHNYNDIPNQEYHLRLQEGSPS